MDLLCTDTHLCIVSKVSDVNLEQEICLPNKEYISCHWCEETDMSAKHKIFMMLCYHNVITLP